MTPVVVWIVALLGWFASVPAERQGQHPGEITIVARQYGYEPHRIVVDVGDTVRLRLVSKDTVHGFFLEGYDLDARVYPGRTTFEMRRPSGADDWKTVEEVVVRFDRPGKFRYRCSITCGTLHPFMQGELIVRPNLPFLAGAAGVFLIGLGFIGWMFVPVRAGAPPRRRLDLLAAVPGLRWFVTQRWFQFAILFPGLLVLVFFIAAGLFGSPIGNRNIIVTIVWILWWFLLITLMVPLGGRVWCLLCPMPSLGEWLARRRLIGVLRPAGARSGGTARKRRWPRRLQNIWVQNILFIAMCSVSTILVTRPAVTAVVLGALMFGAIAVHLVFDRRTFCRYVCPLNGWLSLYSMASVTEVRARDPNVCSTCRVRSCVRGTESAWPCPWLTIPFRLDRNNYCGLCMECVKACPNQNATLLLRPFCSDRTVRGFDEAWIAFIMVALAIAYSVTLLGPWPTVREWANVTEVGNWTGFAIHTAAVWFASLALIPAIWYLASWLSAKWMMKGGVETRQVFLRYSFMLVPLGLMAWIAFSFPLIMVNYTHITSSLSDPLGVGWNLFGTAGQRWQPLLPSVIPYIQVPLLLLGLATALSSGGAVARELCGADRGAIRSLLPHATICIAITLVLLRLHAG
ncbi:MAG: 4Fe-4S binding protein [Betaproteobacteria bacterium]